MDARRWRHVRAIFDAAAESSGAARERAIADGCAGDAALESEVRSLLAAAGGDDVAVLDEEVPDLLAAFADETRVGDGGADESGADEDAGEGGGADEDDWIGRRLGPYRVDETVGRGGMGEVYRARRVDGQYEGDVAIKRVRAGFGAADMRRRFAAERRMLASLDHPHIARLLDAGASEEGEPYLVLEFVEGRPVTQHADAARLDVTARLRLFLDVCDAVSHAHDRLIVHRDLKPSNVLVTADGRVKLLDFGVAKLLDDGDAELATRTQHRLFTPEYAAPEQIRGDVVTTAVDVHALGLLLFDLLAGRRPFRATGRAIERAVLEEEPLRLSAAISRRDEGAAGIAARRGASVERLRRTLRGDLDAIVAKALRKDPRERYSSVRRLADDLRRHLDGRPVDARQGDVRYRASRFVRRHAVALAALAIVVAALATGLGVALWQADEARRQRDVAQAEAAKSRQLVDFMVDLFAQADPGQSRGAQVTARELLVRGVARMRGALVEQPAARADLLGAIGQAQVGLGLHDDGLALLDESVALTDPGDARAVAQAHVRRAFAWQALGRYDDVLEDLGELRARFTPVTRDDRLLQAALSDRLAVAAQAKGELALAGEEYRAAMATRSEVLGTDHPETQRTALRYVSLLTLRGEHQAAKDLAARIVAKLAGATNDPLRADALGALAMAEANLKNADAAEPLRREALAILRSAYGDEHPDTVGAENDLASVVFGQKRYADAVPMFERVLAMRRAQFKPDHPAIATVATNLAWAKLLTGDAPGAFALAEESLRIRRAAYGDRHVSTAMTFRALAAAEIELGRLEDAERHLRDGVAAYEAAVGPDNKMALGTLNDLARVLVLQGKSDGCATAARATRLLGEGDPATLEQAWQRMLFAACRAKAGEAASHAEFARLADQVEALAKDDVSVLRRVETLRDALR